MGQQIDLYKRWRRAKERLAEIFKEPEKTVVVHYSCESFYDDDPKSRRITSIAVRNLETGQTRSYSLHLAAERAHAIHDIEARFDEFEASMLNDFFEFARDHQHHRWIHWNMRDTNYGFPALEHRAAVLNARSFHIDERQLYDLSRILIGIYGVQYIGHPRIETLMKKNSISQKDFLVGQAEADAFQQKRFWDMHRSTLSKVDLFANFAERAHNGTLQTNSNWYERNGRSVKAAFETVREHWFYGLLFACAIGAWSNRDSIADMYTHAKKWGHEQPSSAKK
jgi:hypothetical protein